MSGLITQQDSAIVVIDIQENLAPEILDNKKVIAATQKLLTAANQLAIPTLVTEQYPRGLGHTVDSLVPLIDQENTFEKISFSATGCSEFMGHLKALNRKQLLVCGMESHVCVLQTVLGLLELGYEVFVLEDMISSRQANNKALAIERMRASGAAIVSIEMVSFEWLVQAGTKDFKAVLPLIK